MKNKNLKTQLRLAPLLALILLACTAAYGQFTPSGDSVTNANHPGAATLVADKSASHPTIIEFDAPHAGRGSGQGTWPLGNNLEGVITGYYVDANIIYHGFLRATDGTISSFDAPGSGKLKDSSQGTVPLSIDSRGEVVGELQDENYVFHGFSLAPDGTYAIIDAPNAGTGAYQGTVAVSIGAEGLIAGYYIDANNVYHGFVRAHDGTITSFDAPGAGTGSGQGTVVISMNPEGAIAGYINADNFNVEDGFLRSPDGTFTTIDYPGSAYTITNSINPAGEVTGYFGDANGVGHGLIDVNGNLTTFDDPDAGTGNNQGTYGANVNPEGAILGVYTDSGNVDHGFVLAPDGKFTNFSAPHASGEGLSAGTRPETINPSGAVTGWYVDKNNVSHGFLWTP